MENDKPGALALSVLSSETLTLNLKEEQGRRAALQTFIRDNLTEGTDYGKIHVASRDKCPKPWECKNEHHFSKPSLFKPGAEKFCSLLQLRAEFVTDKETLEMLGDVRGTIAYICRLVHIASNNVIAEGRGSCSLSEKSNAVNTTIKIAEKRAQVDAVLRLGFSDSFTQDVEDLVPVVTEAVKELADQPPATQAAKDAIRLHAFVKTVDFKAVRAYIEEEFGVPFERITADQAAKIAAMLEKKYGPLEAIPQEGTATEQHAS